jgi:hypothetical protein
MKYTSQNLKLTFLQSENTSKCWIKSKILQEWTFTIEKITLKRWSLWKCENDYCISLLNLIYRTHYVIIAKEDYNV